MSFSITPEKNIDDVINEISNKLQNEKDKTLIQIFLKEEFIFIIDQNFEELQNIEGSFVILKLIIKI